MTAILKHILGIYSEILAPLAATLLSSDQEDQNWLLRCGTPLNFDKS